MPKRKITEFKKIVSEGIAEYSKILGLECYQIKVFYENKDKDCKEGKVNAEISVDHRYLNASMWVYPCLIDEWIKNKKTTEEIKDIIAHEVAHLATHKLHWLAECAFKGEEETTDAWEALTTIVGRLLYKVGDSDN